MSSRVVLILTKSMAATRVNIPGKRPSIDEYDVGTKVYRYLVCGAYYRDLLWRAIRFRNCISTSNGRQVVSKSLGKLSSIHSGDVRKEELRCANYRTKG